jgi:hypothetical protein
MIYADMDSAVTPLSTPSGDSKSQPWKCQKLITATTEVVAAMRNLGKELKEEMLTISDAINN